MNHCVPHWILEDDNRYLGELLPAATPQKSMVPDSELIELLWQNGHVAMHNQTHQKCQTATTEFKQAPKPGPLLKCGGSLVNANDLIQDEETSPWFEYSLDDSLEKEFSTGFFCGTPIADATDAYKLNKELTAGEKDRNFVIKESNSFTGFSSKHSSRSFQENKVSVPNSNVSDSTQRTASLEEGGVLNFSHYSRPIKAGLEFLNRELEHNKPGNKNPGGMVESSSTKSIGLSACENSHIEKLVDESRTFSNDVRNAHTRSRKDDDQMSSPHERVQSNANEATATSSSGGSGSSFARAGHQSMSNQNHKRKGRGGESESHSEEAEYESVEANKRAQRAASARRTRAAEVHNLSERRRRDRINEKMRALQELIPHCNKTDKASMLDEAIEYLKSLQLQVQMMWMGSGMAPMMHPGFQSYMPHMGMGMNLAHMPSFPDPIRLPTVPVVNQAIPSSAPIANSASMCSTPALNQDNFPTQMQNIDLTESYARYLSFHHKQQPNQTMYTYGSQTMQQNQQSGSSINMPTAGTAPPAKHSK